jgi:hypothetical protein
MLFKREMNPFWHSKCQCLTDCQKLWEKVERGIESLMPVWENVE